MSLNVLVAVLTAAIGVIGANSLSIGPIAPSIAVDLGTQVATTLYAAGGYGIGTALGALLLSPFIDQVGSRKSLYWALLVLAICFIASASAPTIISLIVAQSIAGLAAGIALPAIYAYASQIAPKGKESTILGRVLVGWTLSMVAGVSLSTIIADLYHWRLVYGILCLLTLAACIAVYCAPRQTASTKPAKVQFPIHALFFPGIILWLLVCFTFMTAFYGIYAYIGDHIHTQLGHPLRAGAWIALTYGAGFAIASLGDPLIDRLGVRRIMPFSMILIATAHVLLALATDSFLLLTGLAFYWGFVNHFGLNIIVAGLSSLHPEKRGIVLGMNSAVTYLAASTGALAFGPLYQSYGFAWINGLATCLLIVAVIIAGLIASRSSEQTNAYH